MNNKNLLSIIACSILYPSIAISDEIVDQNVIRSSDYNTTDLIIKETSVGGLAALPDTYLSANTDIKITINNDLNISSTTSENAYLTVKGTNGSLNANNVNLNQQTYIYAEDANITITGNTILENNASIENLNSTINLNTTTINSTAGVYSDNGNINLNGTTTLHEEAYIKADNNGTLNINNTIIMDGYSSAGTIDGNILVNGDINLDGNASIYSKGNTSSITTNGTINLNSTSSLFSNGNIFINGTTHLMDSSMIDANKSNITISSTLSLDNNSSIIAMGDNSLIDLNGTTTLNNTSGVYSNNSIINLNGITTLHDEAYIKADNNGTININNTITLDGKASLVSNNIIANSNINLSDDAVIYNNSTDSGSITLNGTNDFDGANSGIYIENQSSSININLSNQTNLKNGAYVINYGDGNFTANIINIDNSGFIITNNNILINDINITDSGSFESVLIETNEHNLTINNITIPTNTNIKTYAYTLTDSNLSVYKSFVDSSVFGLEGNDRNTYNTLLYSMDNLDSAAYNALNSNLTNEQVSTAVKTMTPKISASNLGAISLATSTISTISSHLESSSNSGISTGDENPKYKSWVQFYNSKFNQENVGNSFGYKSKGNGIVFGIDNKIDTNILYGLALSFGYTDVKNNDTTSNATTTISNKQFTAYYADSSFNNIIEAYISIGWNKNNSKRDIILGNEKRTAIASYDSKIINSKFSYAIPYKFTNLSILPKLYISSAMVTTDKYEESGANSLDLIVANKDLTKITTGFELNIKKNIYLNNNAIFIPAFLIGYKKDFGDNYSSATSQFRDAYYTFNTDGIKTDSKAIIYGTNIQYKSSDRLLEYKLSYTKEKANSYDSTVSTFTILYKF